MAGQNQRGEIDRLPVALTRGGGSGQGSYKGAVSWSHYVVPTAIKTPTPCPPYAVPAFCSVRARGMNPTSASGGNASVVYVAKSRALLLSGHGVAISTQDSVAFPVDNTAELWIMSSILGDGVLLAVTTSTQSA